MRMRILRKIFGLFGNQNGKSKPKSRSKWKSFLEIAIEIVFWKSKSKSIFGNRFLEIEIEIGFGNRNRNRFLEIVFWKSKSKSIVEIEIAEIEIEIGNRFFWNRNRLCRPLSTSLP